MTSEGVTPNPPAFEAAVRAHLAPHREQFNYDALVHTALDNARFHRWAALVDRFRPLDGASFLSSGCGMGGSLLAYHDAGASRVTGVEVDAATVEMARLRVAEIPSAEVHRVEPDPPLPFDDGAFDVIESMDVIEHVPDPRSYLADLVRVLAPGGLILVVTPNRLWPVEQHLGIAGPPWLPVAAADRLFGRLAGARWLDDDRRFRYSRLAGMRTQNMSLRRLRALAVEADLHLRVLLREGGDHPLPPDHPRSERLLAHPIGKFVAPVRTLAVTLERRSSRG
ncbi:methyltransferase domain-containing protein [Euzebya sp.]|uniref:class I SAM-dependent methyltransferase n=1 Tax=Euzebya sp. TaxID=1971409 RepID=UPI003514FF13